MSYSTMILSIIRLLLVTKNKTSFGLKFRGKKWIKLLQNYMKSLVLLSIVHPVRPHNAHTTGNRVITKWAALANAADCWAFCGRTTHELWEHRSSMQNRWSQGEEMSFFLCQSSGPVDWLKKELTALVCDHLFRMLFLWTQNSCVGRTG